MTTSFPYKTDPFDHQRTILVRSARQKVWAWFMEQGTGKTFVALMNVLFLLIKGLINGVIVIAPNGVHENWASDEIPQHWPEEYPITVWVWKSEAAHSKSYRAGFKAALEDQTKLFFLCMNVQAITTKWGRKACERVLAQRKTMMMVDESTDIKTANSKASKTANVLGRRARYRRILNGTPAGDGNPLDYYGQIRFLNVRILGVSNHAQYKNLVADWEEREDSAAGHQYKVIKRNPDGTKAFKNLDIVTARVARFSSRVLKSECFDLPEKLYGKRYFYLSSEQQRVYDEMQENYMVELADYLVTAELSMVRMLRLHQIACGYLGTEPGEPALIIPGPQPRIEAAWEFVQECYDRPFIIWARYQQDVTLICHKLKAEGITFGRYDGLADDKERLETKTSFQAGHIQGFIGNPQSGGRGLTLTAAHAMLFYSNHVKLLLRQQGEDRGHRYGLRDKLYIKDLIARGTVDQKIVRALREKKNVADTLTGDPHQDWI